MRYTPSILLSLIFLCFFSNGVGQNLVSNPSFEDTVACPSNVNEITNAIGWYSTLVTPDYYNKCAHSTVGIPSNYLGFQNTTTGDAYAGFFAREVWGGREMIGSELIIPLTIGQQYFVSFKVSLADDTVNTISGGSNKIGVIFSVDSTAYYNVNYAHVYTDSVIIDMEHWTTISGTFTADSAYKRIMIGNFFDNNNSDSIMISNAWSSCRSYYYIDDVCVSTDSSICANSVGISEPTINTDAFSIYPNPTTDFFSINNTSSQPYNLVIYNSIGQVLFEEKTIKSNAKKININNFFSNLIFIQIQSNNNSFTYKVLKQ